MKPGYLMLLLCLAVAVARLVPHPFNFTPIGALALFAGTYIQDNRFVLLPVVALLISDMFLGFYSTIVMVGVYLGFACSSIAARLLRMNESLLQFLCGVMAGAVIFYTISNLGMWWMAYPQNLDGLWQCLVDGLPFLLRSVAGDFLYASIMFGLMEHRRFFSPQAYETT